MLDLKNKWRAELDRYRHTEHLVAQYMEDPNKTMEDLQEITNNVASLISQPPAGSSLLPDNADGDSDATSVDSFNAASTQYLREQIAEINESCDRMGVSQQGGQRPPTQQLFDYVVPHELSTIQVSLDI